MKIKNSLISSVFVLILLFSFQINVKAEESEQLKEYVPAEALDFSNIPESIKSEILSEEFTLVNEKEYLTDEQVNTLSVEKFIQVFDELNKEGLLTKDSEEINEVIAEKLLEPNSNTMKRGYLPQAYEDLTSNEKTLVKGHPFEAVVYYKKSTEALNVASSLYSANQLYLGNGDAFRHAYWNAILVKSFGGQFNGGGTDKKSAHGVQRAAAWTTAHEQNSSGIDRQMDLNNNNVGRYHAFLNFNSSEKVIQNNLVKMVNQGQLARVVNNKLVATNSTK